MNNNGRYPINNCSDNDFHIKVNRNIKPYKNQNSKFLSNNHNEVNNLNNYYSNGNENKLKNDQLFIKKKE